jgi:signal transduction histidine kinase
LVARAVNWDGFISAQPATVSFEVLMPFWRRWWFLTLCACALTSLVYGLHQYRVAYLVRLERVRTGIARDLHDDIGASLSQIAVVSELLCQRGNVGKELREPLSRIALDSREMIASMSDIVWAIDPRRDHLRDLLQRMRRFASDMFTAADIRFHFSAPVADLALNADQRRHIFLIFKEAVNNIVRHSGCTMAEICMSRHRNVLLLEIRDNGCGLNFSHVSGGNGLADMRLRAEALGGGIDISHGIDLGTSIRLKVPLGRPPSRRKTPRR